MLEPTASRAREQVRICNDCGELKNCAVCDKLKRKVRVIINQLDLFPEVLGTYFEPQVLAERFFLECHTVLDMRYVKKLRAPDVEEFLRKQHRINPIYCPTSPPSYRWLLFSTA